RVEVIRILAGQIVRFAAMAASPFSLVVDSCHRIHTTEIAYDFGFCLAYVLRTCLSVEDCISNAHYVVIVVVDGIFFNMLLILESRAVKGYNCKLAALSDAADFFIATVDASGRAESHYNGRCYGYGQGYKTYGYAQVAQDLARYCGGYAARYGMYPQAQQ
nr:hypothetical protein [Tanacetum cinerariifolium]